MNAYDEYPPRARIIPPEPDPRQPDPPAESETPEGATGDDVDEQGEESFPASDPPANY